MNARTIRLINLLQFSADDLEANRRGELSPSQRALVDSNRAFIEHTAANADSTRWLPIVFFVGLILLIGVILIVTGVSSQIAVMLGDLAPVVLVGSILLIVVIVLYASRAQKENIAMFKAMAGEEKAYPSVRVVEGRVKTSATRPGYSATGRGRSPRIAYRLRVEGTYQAVELSMTERGLEAFEPGKTYRVFYADGDGTPYLLTAEALE